MVSTRSIVPALALVPLFSLLMTAGCGNSSSPNSHDAGGDANKPNTGGLVGQDASGGNTADANGGSKTDAIASGGQSGGGAGGSGGGATGGSSVVDAAGGAGGSVAEVGSDVQVADAPTRDGPLPDGPLMGRDTAGAPADAPVDGPIDSPIADLGSDTRPDVGTIPSPDTRLDTTRFDTPGADASTPCVNGQACTLAAGGSGLCRSNACVACVDPTDDNACVTTYGATHICSAGQCVAGSCHNSTGCTNGKICGTNHLCGNCASDTACRADSAYGTSRICLNTSCVVGNCHDRTSDCTNGRICNTTNHTCSACTNTNQCTPAGAYGAGYICSPGGACVQGNCQNSQDCPTGSICGVSTALTCGPCTIDSQCKNDARYGAAYMCRTAAGANQGTCFSNSCAGSAAGSVCSTNPADVCCNSACVAGNCCQDSDCAGSNRVCVNNTCTSCAAVTGNQYFVDPVNGSDTAATGSGKTGGGTTDGNCSFKTVTHALSVVGTSAPAGTTITIIGSATATLANPTNMVGEASTIQVPTNVKITTSGGPLRLALGAGAVGFQLVGAGANLAPDSSAVLIIDGGANHLSGWGVRFSATGGTTSISNVTIRNTGLPGIRVDSGTVSIGAGVTVTGAGTASNRQNGLEIVGGTVSINVPAAPATSFSNNTDNGIHVSGTGSLNITGVEATASTTPSTGTVVANANYNAGLEFEQDPGQTSPSVIVGLVAWGTTGGLGHGILIHGGSRITLRRSIALLNDGSGVDIAAYTGTPDSTDISNVDFGLSSDFGRNILQSTAAGTRNTDAGICVELATGTHTLNAQGNTFSASNCSLTGQPALTRAYPCANHVDIGIDPAATTTVNVDGCSLAP